MVPLCECPLSFSVMMSVVDGSHDCHRFLTHML